MSSLPISSSRPPLHGQPPVGSYNIPLSHRIDFGSLESSIGQIPSASAAPQRPPVWKATELLGPTTVSPSKDLRALIAYMYKWGRDGDYLVADLNTPDQVDVLDKYHLLTKKNNIVYLAHLRYILNNNLNEVEVVDSIPEFEPFYMSIKPCGTDLYCPMGHRKKEILEKEAQEIEERLKIANGDPAPSQSSEVNGQQNTAESKKGSPVAAEPSAEARGKLALTRDAALTYDTALIYPHCFENTLNDEVEIPRILMETMGMYGEPGDYVIGEVRKGEERQYCYIITKSDQGVHKAGLNSDEQRRLLIEKEDWRFELLDMERTPQGASVKVPLLLRLASICNATPLDAASEKRSVEHGFARTVGSGGLGDDFFLRNFVGSALHQKQIQETLESQNKSAAESPEKSLLARPTPKKPEPSSAEKIYPREFSLKLEPCGVWKKV